MDINITAACGTVILSTDEYRKLIEISTISTGTVEELVGEIRRLKVKLQQANDNLAAACENTSALKTEIENHKDSSAYWYAEYTKIKSEMQDIKDQLAALGGREETP